uniref:N-acetylmuramoyl-L-alanine amidase n=1 Tax=Mycobacteroides abscessus TaxID=36809 RepID=UPI000C266ED4
MKIREAAKVPKIIQRIIPKGLGNKPNEPMDPKYITIHNTGNRKKGADAENHAKYMENGSGGRQTSWHYTVDDTDNIYQHLSTFEQGWHAGDGNGPGNTQSIGIEICQCEGINVAKANSNAAWLVNTLMKQHSIPLSNVKPHKHWSGKNCPEDILPSWEGFIKMIVNAGKQQGPFIDVAADRWSAPSVAKVKAAGIMGGYSDGSFKPDQPVTREELAAVIVKMKN